MMVRSGVMKNAKALLILAIVSIVSGLILSNIPWGNPAKFHGTGVPIPTVLWDMDPKTGRMLDYPNIAGVFLNIFLVFGIGGIFLLFLKIVKDLRRKS